MRIPIDRESAVPIYRQIELFLRDGILSGALAAETRLPATRQLALDLGVSRVTVENAYADLEAEGLVARQMGSGSYVLPAGPLPQAAGARPEWPLWQRALAGAGEAVPATPTPRPHPDLISFTGFGDPQRFPVEEFGRAMRLVIRRDGVEALAFDDAAGYAPLRATIAGLLGIQGIQAGPESILITAGSQQGLALAAQVLLAPGDGVLVEAPTYDWALALFRANGLRIIGCPADALGMQVEQLEPLLQQHHPKLIYTIPNFQNPSGACLSLPRRRQLLALAERYNVPILEDDFAGDLRYDGLAQPALKALDPGGRVIYVGTFSKMLMPGLRLGFLAAEGPVFNLLAQRKQVADLATSALIQRALEMYVTVGWYQAHLRRSCQAYRRRRDAMVRAAARHLPAGVTCDPPLGGLFLWLRLPAPLTATALAPLAAAEGVECAHGGRFYADPAAGEGYLRLNFAVQTPERIEEGMRRLGRAMGRLGGEQVPRQRVRSGQQ